MEKKEIQIEENKINRYEHKQIPETMRDIILDLKNNIVLSDIDILTEILNKLDKIERSVA